MSADQSSLPGVESEADDEIGFGYLCDYGHVHLHLHGRAVQVREDGCLDIVLSRSHAKTWVGVLYKLYEKTDPQPEGSS